MSTLISTWHELSYHDCPMDTHKAGEVLAALVERYGVEELTDLSRRSGIPRTTLQNWHDRPETAVRSAGRKYLRQAVEPHTTPDDLAALLTEVRDLLRSLLTLEKQGRAEAVVKAKRHGGAA